MLKSITTLPVFYWISKDAEVQLRKNIDGYSVLVNGKVILRIVSASENCRGLRASLSVIDQACNPKIINEIIRPSTRYDDCFIHTNQTFITVTERENGVQP